jgi:hypothetical protein
MARDGSIGLADQLADKAIAMLRNLPSTLR